MNKIKEQKNIRNVIRYDINGDALAPSFDVFRALKTKGENHFYYTKNNEGQQDELVENIYQKGIR